MSSKSSSSSSSVQSNQYWTSNRIKGVAAGVVISAIVGGILYAIISNSTAKKPDDTPTDQNSVAQSATVSSDKSPANSTGATGATGANLPVAPVIRYVKQEGSYWDAGEIGSYTCPNAVGVNTTGDAGAYAKYCIFTGASAKVNAEKQCSVDNKCLGYVVGKLSDGTTKVQLTSRGVENTENSPNEFYAKTPSTAKMYKVKPGRSYWDAGTIRYTCPNAIGVNKTGNAGDFANYCIFTGENAQANAAAQCSVDSKCLGYSVGKLADGSAKVQLTASGPVASGGNNKYFQKM